MEGVDAMKYQSTTIGRFVRRINRFVAEVKIDGTVENVHVKNTGRLKELLLPEAEVILEPSANPERKTKYSLLAVRKKGRWVNIDSQAPNTVVFEALKQRFVEEWGTMDLLKREVTYGHSRFDLYFECGHEKGFIEIKGVTLEKDGIAMFPDAPTTRGTKHIEELAGAVRAGYTGVVFFLIQMKGCHAFTPNEQTDKPFAEALRHAAKAGVRILAYDSFVSEDEIVLDRPIEVRL